MNNLNSEKQSVSEKLPSPITRTVRLLLFHHMVHSIFVMYRKLIESNALYEMSTQKVHQITFVPCSQNARRVF